MAEPQEEYDKAYYERIAEQYRQTHGELTPAADGVIQTAALLEMLKEKARADIASKGLRETVRNGRQAFLRENKSLGQLLKLSTSQAALLQTLKLLPSRRTAPKDEDEDEEDGDPADELNDY